MSGDEENGEVRRGDTWFVTTLRFVYAQDTGEEGHDARPSLIWRRKTCSLPLWTFEKSSRSAFNGMAVENEG